MKVESMDFERPTLWVLPALDRSGLMPRMTERFRIGNVAGATREGSDCVTLYDWRDDEWLGSATSLENAKLFAASLLMLRLSDDGAEVTAT